MTETGEVGEASKDVSEYADAEMMSAAVEGEKMVDKDEIKEGKQMRDEQEIEEEDEEEVDDQIANEDLLSKHPAGTEEASNKEDNTVCDSKNGDAQLHEEDPESMNIDEMEEEKIKGSVKMHPGIPSPDKSVDHDEDANEKICERNEQSSVGAHDEQYNNAISVKCDDVSEYYSASVNGAMLGRSSVDDVGNSEVDDKEKKKEIKTYVGNLRKIKDMQMAMESTERTRTFMLDDVSEGCESGTEEEQSAFMIDLEKLFREKNVEFKAPKFYGVPVNLLKLWRAVIKLGGYDKVTACKLWRQVGESFNPPKTCTTVSFTFRIFYEKSLLEYERHKIAAGELDIPTYTEPVAIESQAINSQASGSGRARRDAAARAMQGWHSQRLLGNGEVSDPLIKDKGSTPLKNREKHQKSMGAQKRKKPLAETAVKGSHSKLMKGLSDTAIIDLGPPADWVKISVRSTPLVYFRCSIGEHRALSLSRDCYEIYALVPGLLREEIRVQSDPSGRLVISGEPEQPDNPWGVTPFKKVVSLPSRIDPHQTSAVVTLHGQLFVRAPFEQSD